MATGNVMKLDGKSLIKLSNSFWSKIATLKMVKRDNDCYFKQLTRYTSCFLLKTHGITIALKSHWIDDLFFACCEIRTYIFSSFEDFS